jgi:hypothetical protein
VPRRATEDEKGESPHERRENFLSIKLIMVLGESERKEKEAQEGGYRGEVLILSPSINN